MGICWYCYWGWPKAIKDIYEQATEKLDGDTSPLNFGPAHIVWEEENWDSAQWCIDNFDKYSKDLSEHEKSVVMWSLRELLKLPEHVLNAEPDDYDDENPANYPPPANIEWETQEARQE
jgi:hypothetical protein